jgi:hypothetical protein
MKEKLKREEKGYRVTTNNLLLIRDIRENLKKFIGEHFYFIDEFFFDDLNFAMISDWFIDLGLVNSKSEAIILFIELNDFFIFKTYDKEFSDVAKVELVREFLSNK